MFHVKHIGLQNGINRMGIFNLFRLCLGVFSFSALASPVALAAGGGVSVDVSPTTTYTTNSRTFGVPPGTSTSPVRDITPSVTRTGTGTNTRMHQTFRTGITITATQQRSIMTGSMTATLGTMKNGAKGALRGGLAGVALGVGLQGLLNGLGWIINEGSVAQRKPNHITEPPDGATRRPAYSWYEHLGTPAGEYVIIDRQETGYADQTIIYGCLADDFIGYSEHMCYYMKDATPDDGFTIVPVPPQDIDDGVDNNYDPDPSDWRNLVPFMQPDTITVDQIPSIQYPPSTTTNYDSDGNPTSTTEEKRTTEFDVRGNGTAKPDIDMTDKTEKTDYKDGQKTGSTTTETKIPAGETNHGSGGGAPAPEFELPPFCSWAGIICDWIGWTQEPIEDDIDLSAIITDEDYERNYSINFGEGACPAPILINVAFINKNIELSYEPACELASYAKPFVLISAYIFAIFITLGVVRNG